MRRALSAAFERLVDRHGGYLRLGPVYVTSWSHSQASNRNAFEIGRDHERGLQKGGLA